jgi:Na+/H+-dicarboxylate symporter
MPLPAVLLSLLLGIASMSAAKESWAAKLRIGYSAITATMAPLWGARRKKACL